MQLTQNKLLGRWWLYLEVIKLTILFIYYYLSTDGFRLGDGSREHSFSAVATGASMGTRWTYSPRSSTVHTALGSKVTSQVWRKTWRSGNPWIELSMQHASLQSRRIVAYFKNALLLRMRAFYQGRICSSSTIYVPIDLMSMQYYWAIKICCWSVFSHNKILGDTLL